jgi:hypothetical protein
VVFALLALVACGPKSMRQRMNASEKLANQVDELLSKAEKAITDVDPPAVESALKDAKKVISDPDAQLYPEYEMLTGRLKDDEAKLPAVRKLREKKDLEAAVAKQRDKIEELVARVKKDTKALEDPNVESGSIDDLEDAAKDLAGALKDGAELEAKDKAYAEYAKKQRELSEKAKDPVALARARVEFMKGPAALRDQAAQKLKDARAATKPDDKRSALTDAKALYEKCQDASRKLLMANPAMSRLPIMAAGKKSTPEELDTACSKEWQEADKALKRLPPPKPASTPKPVPAPKPKKK